jgi:protein-S-isoprenylcysteine O-methyltransferase Ste14
MNATDTPRDAVAVRIFPPAAPLATGIGLEHILPVGPGILPGGWAGPALGGLVIVGAVGGLGLRAVLTMRRTGQSENPWKPTTEIVAEGPYRYTRNPMYLQMLLICLGIALMLQNIWIILLTPVCFWALTRFAILPEEAYLERKFGDTYRDYKQRVRRWL